MILLPGVYVRPRLCLTALLFSCYLFGVGNQNPSPVPTLVMPPPTTVVVPTEPRERSQPEPTWRRPEYAAPNNGVTQFAQASHHAPPPSHPPHSSSAGSAMVKKAEDHAKKAGAAANHMSMNPMDLFLRMQFQNAMNELNRTMKQLALEVKKGTVSQTEVREIQTKLATVFEREAENPKAGQILREHAREGFGVLGAAMEENVDLLPSPAATAGVLTDSSGALKQMDTLLVPGLLSPAAPRDSRAPQENVAKETTSASVVGLAKGRGIRLADGSVGEGATDGEREVASISEATESEEQARLHEEVLVAGTDVDLSREEAREEKSSREPASSGLWGKKLPFKIHRADGRAVNSLSELTWEDLIYFGGRLALLTVITCVSLCLLAFYLGSTLATRRRAAEKAPGVPPYDPPPPPYA